MLNGGSSSGKSGIARCLQAVLPDQWLAFGTDSLIEAMPARMTSSAEGIVFAEDGGVSIGPEFRALQAAWRAGIRTMAREGARIILDDVFLGGAATQEEWREVLSDVHVTWIGVRCDPAVAAGRETARGDRVPGMAQSQADLVHRGVRYDLEVDSTHTESMDCARRIAEHIVAPQDSDS